MASPPWINSAQRLAAAIALAAALVSMPSAHAATYTSSVTRWSTDAEFGKGGLKGLRISGGALTLSNPLGPYTYADPYGKTQKFSYGNWTSPWVATTFGAKSIIPSWNVTDIPNGTWVRVELRGRSGSTIGSWDKVADWAHGTAGTHRNSGTSQTDDLTRLAVDNLLSNGTSSMSGWQLRISLVRPYGTSLTPKLTSVGAVASSYSTAAPAVSTTTMTSSKELAVPRYSQMIHRGEFPQYGGGGASWCSPTSTSMVLRYFGSGPKAADYSWSPYPNSWVDYAARYTYDYRYEGAGNWPFNTAYAGRYGLDAFVTRLANLRDAEAFIKAGIPVVASVRYASGQLSGAPVSSSAGHLLVIVGVLADGRVVANDPAAGSNSTVRRVYKRSQFEKAWLGGSGGVSYIIRPTSKPLPPDTARW